MKIRFEQLLRSNFRYGRMLFSRAIRLTEGIVIPSSTR